MVLTRLHRTQVTAVSLHARVEEEAVKLSCRISSQSFVAFCRVVIADYQSHLRNSTQ